MRIPRLKSCCCCSSVVQGALFIAWLQVIGAVLSALISLSSIFLLDENALRRHNDRYTGTYSTDTKYKVNPEDVSALRTESIVMFVINTILSVIYILYLIGIKKRNSCLMMPNIIFGVLILILLILVAAICVIVAFFYPLVLMMTVPCAVYFVVHGYYWLVLYSAYMEVKEDQPIDLTDKGIENGSVNPKGLCHNKYTSEGDF